MDLPSLEIPAIAELAKYRQFVCWKRVSRGGKETKVPINARTGSTASVTNPDSWCWFSDAWHRCESMDDVDGVGFVFTANDPFVGIDIDHCLDEEGQLINGADLYLSKLDSYTEIGPSGDGLHIIGMGELPQDGIRNKGEFEAYHNRRFFTLTGKLLEEDGRNALKALDAGLDWLVEKDDEIKARAGKKAKTPAAGTPAMEDLVARLDPIVAAQGPVGWPMLETAMVESHQLVEIWERNDRDKGWSPSEWDLALANHLLVMHFTPEETTAILIAYRETHRESLKLRPDYYARTIEKAYDNPWISGRAADVPEHQESHDQGGARHVLFDLTRWPIMWFNKYEASKPVYSIELKDGRTLEFDLKHLDTPLATRRLFLQFISEPSDPVCPVLTKAMVEAIRTSLFQVIRKIDIGMDATERGYIRSQMVRFMRHKMAPLENFTADDIDQGQPILWQDNVWISLHEFKDTLSRTFGERVDKIRLNKLMIQAGSRSHTIGVKDREERPTTRRVWLVPDDLEE